MFKNFYNGWINSRMNGVNKYVSSEYFKSKTLLEVGCGHADVGNRFHELGAIVTSTDARKEHIAYVNETYPHIKTAIVDYDKNTVKDKYDIIIHWGLLNHLKEIDKHLENISQKCNVLFLDSEVADSDDDTFYASVDERGFDQAFHNKGIRTSPTYIEKLLEKNGFQFKLIEDHILDAGQHHYVWTITNTKRWMMGLRRFWICWKNVESPLKPTLQI